LVQFGGADAGTPSVQAIASIAFTTRTGSAEYVAFFTAVDGGVGTRTANATALAD
jgi:hypothetical protein